MQTLKTCVQFFHEGLRDWQIIHKVFGSVDDMDRVIHDEVNEDADTRGSESLGRRYAESVIIDRLADVLDGRVTDDLIESTQLLYDHYMSLKDSAF